MYKALLFGAALLAVLCAPAGAAKLDNANAAGAASEAPAVEEQATGPSYFASKLPLTSAVVERDFAIDYSDIVASVDAGIAASADDVALTTTLVDGVTRVAISYELKVLDAPADKLTEIIDLQAAYITAMLESDGPDVCAPAIFDGSRDLIGRGLWDKYASRIDATVAAFFSAVKLAMDSPSGIGDMQATDGPAVVEQMTAQGDKALMDHFSVMTRESPENCPAVLAIIEAVKALEGDARLRMIAAQARGASRL